MRRLNEFIHAKMFSTQEYCDSINNYCHRNKITLIKSCRFDESKYTVILENIQSSDKLRNLLAELEILCRSHGRNEIYVISSSMGLKVVVKVFDQ